MWQFIKFKSKGREMAKAKLNSNHPVNSFKKKKKILKCFCFITRKFYWNLFLIFPTHTHTHRGKIDCTHSIEQKSNQTGNARTTPILINSVLRHIVYHMFIPFCREKIVYITIVRSLLQESESSPVFNNYHFKVWAFVPRLGGGVHICVCFL